MNWLIPSIIAIIAWSAADLFYKRGGSDLSERFSNLRIGVWTGIAMGILFPLALPYSESGGFCDLVAAHPWFSLFMLGYATMYLVTNIGLKYLDMTVMSPVENSGGALPPIILFAWYAVGGRLDTAIEESSLLDFIASAIVIGGVIGLGFAMRTKASRENALTGAKGLFFPLVYAVADALLAVVIAVALDNEDGCGIGEMDMLLMESVACVIIGVGSFVALLVKKDAYNPFRKQEWPKAAACSCEAVANVAYIWAIAANPLFACPFTASYCALTVILCRFILHEKPSKKVYAAVAVICIGIILFGFSEAFSE